MSYQAHALNIYDASNGNKAMFDFSSSENEGKTQRELRFLNNGGTGTIQFPGPVAFWHLGQRSVLGKRFADLDTAMAAEQASRVAADTSQVTTLNQHYGLIVAEQNARSDAVASLQASIGQNYAAVTQESADRSASDADLGTRINNNFYAISGEQADRAAADTALSNRIDDEVTARTSGDSVERQRAEGVETGLQTQISNLLSNTDSVALNSLAEIVADYNSLGVTSGSRFDAIEAAATSTNTALAAAVARIAALEAIIALLIETPPTD